MGKLHREFKQYTTDHSMYLYIHKGCAKKNQSLDIFVHGAHSFWNFLVKIYMSALHCMLELSPNWFWSMLFRFEMRANPAGVGGELALRRNGSWRIDSRNTWFVFSWQMDIISFTILHLSCITLYFKQNIKLHVVQRL